MLRRGSKGAEVRALQERLIALGHLTGAADGDFGPMTEAAVKAFQTANGLTADGIVGPRTQAVLDASGSGPPAPTPTPTPSPSGTFTPVVVENPGGGRITDKSEPAAADRVDVARRGGGTVTLHRLAADAWAALTAAARADGIAAPLLEPTSGYRSVARQQELFDAAVARYGSEAEARRWVAKPGGSPHHSGRAIDCWMGTSNDSRNVDTQRDTDVWRWLDANAERFGFYPYPAEPWHWEYNPPATP